MPIYHYKARNADGTVISGTLDADSESELYQLLADQNRILLSSYRAEEEKKRHRPLKLVSLSDFSRQLATLIGSGVTLSRALSIIANDDALKEKERSIYQDILSMVKLGFPLSDSMEDTKVFPDFMINLIRSAENGGNLEKTALRLADHYEKKRRLNGKISMAFLYPKILSAMIVVVVVLLCNFVIPTFADLFKNMPSLPALTVFVLGFGTVVTKYWYILILGAVALWALGKWLYTLPSVHIFVDKIKLKIPVFGKLNQKVATANFALTLSTLYSSGISIISALQIASRTIGNAYIENQFSDVLNGVRSGENLSDALDRVDGFSRKLISAIRVGEESGSLESMLTANAAGLSYEADLSIDKMVSYLEPMIIIVLACVVGVIVIGVLLPIADSYQYIGGPDIAF